MRPEDQPQIALHQSLFTKILDAWHTSRTPIILSALVLCLLVQFAFTVRRWCRQTAKTKTSVAEKVSISDIAPSHTGASFVSNQSRNIGNPQFVTKDQQLLRKINGVRKKRVFPVRDHEPLNIQIVVFLSSLSGATEKAASDVSALLRSNLQQKQLQAGSNTLDPWLVNLSDCEYDDFFVTLPNRDSLPSESNGLVEYFYLVLVPTYNIDTYLDNFIEYLKEIHYDFRIDTGPLSGLLGFAVFGFGDKNGWPTEAEGFCSQAAQVDKWLAKLTGGKRAYPIGMGDVQNDATESLSTWLIGVEQTIRDLAIKGTLGEGVPGSGNAFESDVDEDDDGESDEQRGGTAFSRQRRRRQRNQSALGDVEDLGASFPSKTSPMPQPLPIDFTTSRDITTNVPTPLKEMVPKESPTYTALTKQGYTIVGSHSGVKICRWTKSALRGRGSCYKFSFYGIKSHLCMETTPSLSCSNKCVFCWRHGTNPVGTTWRWQVDPPEMIFNGVKEGHYKKIKMLKGVPGVRAERFQEAMQIRHCALSLVGEPIFYPHINEFTAMLHNERISSFLVCNAQHPDQLARLNPVTQLYVSIDASNKDSLRKIDRPLHRDFWERFCRCLDIIREKRFRQRTVFRLTLVKGFNIEDEAEGYADLVARGLPCFVEVKGVTYCGTSTSAGAGLTMQNVPFYHEVCAFVEALSAALERRGLGYGIAAEHAHSCCILIASDRFRVDGHWHTVIDYGRFFECLDSGKEFAPEDYIAPTPEWALWGNGGFDPADERVDRKGRKNISSNLAAPRQHFHCDMCNLLNSAKRPATVRRYRHPYTQTSAIKMFATA